VLLPLIQRGNDVIDIFFASLSKKGLTIKNGDIIAFSDKIIAISEGRYVNLSNVKPSPQAKILATKYELEPEFVELVIREADEILGGVPRALLTIKNNIIIANAGMDHKNAPPNSTIMWPLNPSKIAAKFRQQIESKTGKKVGVMIIDSHVIPMRMGTLGFALGLAGFRPIKDCRGKKDLYGKLLLITRINLADDLASAAHLLMGETTERKPIVLIRNSNIEITDNYDPNEIIIPKDECLFLKNLRNDKKPE